GALEIVLCARKRPRRQEQRGHSCAKNILPPSFVLPRIRGFRLPGQTSCRNSPNTYFPEGAWRESQQSRSARRNQNSGRFLRNGRRWARRFRLWSEKEELAKRQY